MLETYTGFMIFEVKDTEEEFIRLNTTEEAFRQNHGNKILHPQQVIVIIKEALRRIYIWKGISSSVRKKFIASRVASDLQRRLIDSSNFHRCKIISVDQGDEPEEFLNAFGFKKLPFIANSDIPNDLEIKDCLPNLEWKNKHEQNKTENIKELNRKPEISPSYQDLKKNQSSRKILERVLKENIPENFTRSSILIGRNVLFGQITKKAEIFDESVEVKEWELISNLPKQIIELEGQKLRIYLNQKHKEIEAIEILEKKPSVVKHKRENGQVDYSEWTVKQLKQFCGENAIKLLSSYRKADMVKAVTEFTNKC
jgi:hypothetical protein